jgi:hypothetical protein
MSTVAERFVYALGLEVDEQSFDKGNKHLDKLGGMLAWIGALALAGASAMVGLVRATANEADQAIKTADALGLTVEQFQELNHVAELNGLSQEKFSVSLERMVRRLSMAVMGTGEAKDAIGELGITTDKLEGMGTYEKFLLIADGLNNLDSQSEKVRLGFQIFGRDISDLLLVMRGGSETIKQTGSEMDKFGLITEKDARKYEEFNDELNRGWKIIKGIGYQVSSNLLPGFLKMVTASKEWMLSNREIVRTRIDTFAMAVAAAFNIAWISMKSFGVSLAWVVNLVGGFEKAFQLVLSMGIASFLVAAITGFVALSKAISLSAVAFSLMGKAPALAKFLLLVTAIEDIITWVRGGNSLTGSLIGNSSDFVRDFKGMFDEILLNWDLMVDGMTKKLDAFKAYFTSKKETAPAAAEVAPGLDKSAIVSSINNMSGNPSGLFNNLFNLSGLMSKDIFKGGGTGAGSTTNTLTVNQTITGSNAPAAAALSVDGIRNAQQELQGAVK